MRPLVFSSLLLCAACAAPAPVEAPPTTFGGDRPTVLQVPADYDGSTPRPLLVVLHGYTSNGRAHQRYFGLDSIVDREGTFLLAPNGLVDAQGNRYWNATDACCDLGGTGVDDVAYLRGLLAEVRAAYRIDPDRVYLIGHSNGGFMAYRMACEAAGEVSAIVALAGATWEDPVRCSPAEGVSVLALHGDADRTILYGGGEIQGHAYPGALETVERWRVRDGCGAPVEDPVPLDVDRAVGGAETVVTRWPDCAGGRGVELWTLQGSGHGPMLRAETAEWIWTWLEAHAGE